MQTLWHWCESHKLKGMVPNKAAPTLNVNCKWGPQASGTSDWLQIRGVPVSLSGSIINWKDSQNSEKYYT